MGAFTAVISANIFDEAKRYVETILQAGVPLVDADYNDQMDSFYTQMRRIIINSMGDGAPNVAFQIQQNPLNLSNDFNILGGTNGDEGPEEMFVKGFQAQLPATESYLIDGETAPLSTGIVGNQLIDTAANYTPGSLVGKVLIPNLGDPGTFFTITANTATTITCGPLDNLAAGADPGDPYRVKLTTPAAGPPRLDLVYLDIYLDDYGAAKDPDLYHNIDGQNIEAMHRKKLIQRVLVQEGITLPVTLPPGYTDSDGNRHVQIPLALISRPGGNPQITNPMITDLRRKIFQLDNLANLFVQKSGDTMTGPLVMEANIIMASGQKVTGLCVIDGDALCDEVVAQRHFERDSHLLGDGGVVPTFEQVNDPLDPNHFEVHDNRYYTRSQIDSQIGNNLLVNGGFDSGIDGWENALPHPLSGAPQADAAMNVIVSTALCGSACAAGGCKCRTLKMCILPGSRICFVNPIRQVIDCLRCGGEFMFIETMCVSRGNECIVPYVIIDQFSSCQYIGTRRVPLFIPTATKCGITKDDGFVRLTTKITLPGNVDRAIVTLSYEITPNVVLPPPDYPYPYYQPFGPDQTAPKCEIGPEGLEFSVCAAQLRRISGLEAAGSPVTACRTNSIPIIENLLPGNTVEFTPGADQVSTLVEVLEETDLQGNPTGMFPLDFPGPQFEADTTKMIQEVPLFIVPLKTCECFAECGDKLGYSYGLCPSISVGKAVDDCALPLVALHRDKTKKIAYWGQDDDTLMDADVVLTPAKYINDPLVGINGSGGYNPDGSPQPGDLAAMARATQAKYGTVAFKIPPSIGCRNLWMDFAYLDEMLCLGVDPQTRIYTFFDSECACIQISHTQEISDLITDACLDRILPDDGFQAAGVPALPTGYPEAISFEYCALPRVDRAIQQQNAFFEFRRETPACARPGAGYYVRVEITALQLPMTVQWADVLPAGHTLLSGLLSDTLVFSQVGQTIIREYVVKVAPMAASGQITGTAQVIGMPSTVINLTSDPTIMDPDCPTLCFFGFGSQTPNVFGKVYWAGGGRFDPNIPASQGLWVTVYAGQGSGAGKSAREQFLISNETVNPGDTTHVFHVGPSGTDGFAAGLPVWVFNKCFEDNPQRDISCIDIEQENAKVSPDENVTGLYGVVTAVDAINNTITVQFNAPASQTVQFTTLARATIMVAPANSMGFYWEASPGLTDLLNGAMALGQSVIRWNYRFWNSTRNPCPGTLGAAFVADGNGEDFNYPIPGDVQVDVINPVDWIDLWCSPVQPMTITQDVNPGDTTLHVCDICLVNPCDIIEVVDQNCTGREGGGPGLVTAAIGTVADNLAQVCGVLHDVRGQIQLSDPVPASIIGCPGFTGFKIASRARAFIKPDVMRFAFGLTTTCDDQGCPTACVGSEEESVCVDFADGRFTFSENVDIQNPLICYRALNGRVQIPNVNAIYFLRAIDKTGCKSPPSKPIRVLSGGGGGGGGSKPISLLAMKVTDVGSLSITAGSGVTDLPDSTLNFVLTATTNVEFFATIFENELGMFQPDSGMTGRILLFDIGNSLTYDLEGLELEGNVGGTPAVVLSSGNGTKGRRVLTLAPGSYSFKLQAVVDSGTGLTSINLTYPLVFTAKSFGTP